MKKNILVTLLILCAFFGRAHNGKTAIVKERSITVDGNAKDWEGVKGIEMGERRSKDFYGNFKLAWNESQQSLFIFWEYQDNNSTPEDTFEFYLNCGHFQRAPSNMMLKFRDGNFSLFRADRAKDPVHSKFKDDDITYEWVKKEGRSQLEIQVKMRGFLKSKATIGFDLLAIDSDSGEEDAYFNWGRGYYGFLKEYNAGQLGDLVLVSNETTSLLSGNVSWEDPSFEDPIGEIKITSTSFPNLWVATPVDSLGNFEVELPVGEYRISSFYKISNPWASWGENNQFRIDETSSIIANTSDPSLKDALVLSTYAFPDFILPKKGALRPDGMFDAQLLSSFVLTSMNYYNIPGASIAVIKDKEIIYHNTFGVSNLLTERPVNETDVFQAASVTKPVFAFIVNRLIDRGILELDKPLYQYLPFPNLESDKRYELMTARHVLSHQSGLPNWAWGGPHGWKSNEATQLLFTPGEKYGYSGEAFQYLGRVVEQLTSKDLNILLKEEVCDVLDISGVYFNGNEGLNMVNGHVQDYPTFYAMVDEPGVAHSLLTEAKGFAGFVNALLQKKGMSQKQYDAMFQTEIVIDSSRTQKDNYWNQGLGLGFFTQDTSLGKAVMHGGSNGDFQSEFVMFPKLGAAFIMFTNGNSGHKLGQALGRYLFYGRE